MKLQIKFESEYCINDYLTKTGADKTTIKYKRVRKELGHLVGMPRYVKEYAEIANTRIDVEDLEEFKTKYGLVCKSNDKSIWWTYRKGRYTDCYYTDDNPQLPKTPIYILSRGRYDCCKTANSLLEMGLTDFKIIVELDEWDKYAEVYGEQQLLLLTQEYKDNTVLESTHDRATMSTGSIPARNFAWEHSMSLGHEYHIVLDKQ